MRLIHDRCQWFAGIDTWAGDIIYNPDFTVWVPMAYLRFQVIVAIHPKIVSRIIRCIVLIPVTRQNKARIYIDIPLAGPASLNITVTDKWFTVSGIYSG